MNDDKNIKKALVIRFRRVGDAVLAICICRSLKETFPNIQVDFVINENIAPLFTNQHCIDNLVTFNDEENHNIRKYISRVRSIMYNGKYEIIIDMRATVKTLLFCLFSLHTPFRIGTKKAYSLFLNNYRIDNRKNSHDDMITCNLLLLKPLEKITSVQYDTSFSLNVPENEKNSYREYMQEQGIDFSKPIILIAAATRIAGKGWNLERMKDIIRRIIDKYHPQIILNYAGKRELDICKELYQKLDSDKHIFLNIEAKNLIELRALTSLCDFFFGNEGGPRHIAQALDIPAYAIYPPGVKKSLWLPTDNTRWQGISPDDIAPNNTESTVAERFDLLTVENVWQDLNKMLDSYLKKSL